MKLLIVTGMSGAGKSQAANALEDMGYYCVDNIPPSIIPAFVELSARGNSELSRLAIVTDIRGGEMFSELSGVLENLRKNQAYFKILFLDASNEVLINRYKENRRKHPLCEKSDITLSAAVAKEREILSQIRFEADNVVDTSRITSAQLKGQISDIFFGNINNGLKIQCKSFGFKYGADSEADMVFDVRCLPNPFYVDDLKEKTGIVPCEIRIEMTYQNEVPSITRAVIVLDKSDAAFCENVKQISHEALGVSADVLLKENDEEPCG